MTPQTEQTLESQWGRAPLTVDAIVPTVMLRHHLGRTHVGTSDLDVLRDVSAAIRRQLNGRQACLWTREMRRQTFAAALWLHHENQAEYRGVMAGSLAG